MTHLVSPAQVGVQLAPSGGSLVRAATSVPALNRFEGHRLEVDQHRDGYPVLVTSSAAMNRPFVNLANLRACSEGYDISADPKDYVFTEIPANNVGIPNRNMDSFEMEDVTEWRPELGRIAWQTYRWKASNINHENKEPLKAKGVIFDSYMTKLGSHWHVMIVAGWCRQKDNALSTRIFEGRDAGYSMACLVGEARCSICDFKSKGGNVTCKHVKGGLGKGTVWPVTNQLVYEKCGKLNYFEISHVEDRADIDCVKRWVA